MPKQIGGRDEKERRRIGEFNDYGTSIVRYLNSQMLASESKVRVFEAFYIGRALSIHTETVSDVLSYLGAGTNGITIEK